MGAQRSEDLAERFLQYLLDERAIEVERKRSADRTHVEASMRIRAIDKEIKVIRGDD